MEGESSGVHQAHGQVEQGENWQQGGQEPGVDAQAGRKQDQQEPQKNAVNGGDTDYAAQLKAKDAQIEELSAKVADAAKSQKAAEDLGRQIAELKQQMADERTDFALRAAGCRSTKAARALLADHDGDVQKLKEAEPWLFSTVTPEGGATGLEPAGASGGSAERERLRHWRDLAGLSDDDEGKE